MILLPHLWNFWHSPSELESGRRRVIKDVQEKSSYEVLLQAAVRPSGAGQCAKLMLFSSELLLFRDCSLLRNPFPVGDVPSHIAHHWLWRPQEPPIPVASLCQWLLAQASQSNSIMVPCRDRGTPTQRWFCMSTLMKPHTKRDEKAFNLHNWGLWGEQTGLLNRSEMAWESKERRPLAWAFTAGTWLAGFEGVPRLCYQLVQVWTTCRRRWGEAWGWSAVSHQTWSQTPDHTQACTSESQPEWVHGIPTHRHTFPLEPECQPIPTWPRFLGILCQQLASQSLGLQKSQEGSDMCLSPQLHPRYRGSRHTFLPTPLASLTRF